MSFKMYTNFIDAGSFFKGLSGNENFGLGDSYFHQKPISMFNDYMPTTEHLSYNPYNILMIMEPNEYFGLHDYAIQHHDKFSAILTGSKKVLDACDNAMFFPFGISWLDQEFIDRMGTKEKTFEVSFLCGGKQKLEGHAIRHELHRRNGEIKIPKKGFYTLPDYDYANGEHKVTDMYGKKVCGEDSMFSICIENTSHHGYHTEKIIDAFLSKTVPIYGGCKDISEMYDGNGIIYCNTVQEFIDKTNALTEDDYYSRKGAIDHNYQVASYYADLFGRLKSMLVEIIELNEIEDSIYCSQELEDKWIDENLILPDKGFFVELGGCYPILINNTYFLEKQKGGTGMIVEPDPVYFSLLKEKRNCILEQVAVSNKEDEVGFKPMSNITDTKEKDSIKVKCVTFDSLLEKHNVKEIDLLSIDLEGHEKKVWEKFDVEKYKPKVIIAEHTSFGTYDDSFTKLVLQNKNYRIIHRTALNHIIIRDGVKTKGREQ